MKKWKVEVEKRMHAIGTVEIECNSKNEAVLLVQSKIDKGNLQTTDIEWELPEYEDFSFQTNGKVSKSDTDCSSKVKNRETWFRWEK